MLSKFCAGFFRTFRPMESTLTNLKAFERSPESHGELDVCVFYNTSFCWPVSVLFGML